MKTLATLAVGCLLLAGKLEAQSDSTRRDTATTNLKPMVVIGRGDGRYKATVSRSATKTDTPLLDTPQSVTVITKSFVSDHAMQGMADVVRFIPGVTMGQGEGHRDQPTIRGNSSTADFFVDGFRDDAQYFRDLYNAEQIESLRGSNAMIFGRGGAGGVINRVSKEAQWATLRGLSLEGGSRDHKRVTLDLGQPWSSAAAGRVNAMYQNSGAFRDRVRLRRFGVNPTIGLRPTKGLTVNAGYEHFDDHRTVDRGIPSFQGAPSHARPATFFGQPDSSYGTTVVDAGSLSLEQRVGTALTLRNRARAVHYDKFYQNIFPGAVNATETQVSLSGYSNGIGRTNLINQTEVLVGRRVLGRWHTILAGVELGHQASDNVRKTAYFNGTATSVSADFTQPTISTAAEFRPSATDPDNHVLVKTGAVYLQDQVTISSHLQAILGLRAERFDIAVHNNRDGADLSRIDDMLSPRAGLVIKPVMPLSIYGSYGVSRLPSSGDQFSSLTATTQTLEPEAFTNAEAGVKWDIRPSLSFTAASYRLDRTKTSAKDPNDPTKTVQTGSQRTSGLELSVMGAVTSRWQAVASYTAQKARVTSATSSAAVGARTPLVPARMMSVWNKYQVSRAWAVGLGASHQSEMYAAIDNSVTLPAFTRVDAALYADIHSRARLQVNVENALDARYYVTAHSNNNISPGAPRTIRVGLTTR